MELKTPHRLKTSKEFSYKLLLAIILTMISSGVHAQTADSKVKPEKKSSTEEKADKDKAVVLNRVRVNSRRKSQLEKLKDVPESISIVSGEELAKQEVSNFRDVLKRIGNIKWGGSSTNPTTTALTLRGVGYLGSGGALGIDSSINTTVDEVPFIISNMSVFNSYYDLESVDVARGPQGTTGGYSASLGKISFRSRQPSFEPEAGVSLTYGANNTLFLRGYGSGTLIPELAAWRGTFYREQADGWVSNNYYSSKGDGGNEVRYGNTDRTYGKLQLLITPTEDFKARLIFDLTPNNKEYGISSNGGIFPRAVPDYYDTLDANGNRLPVNQANQDTGKLNRRWFNQSANWSYDGNYLKESNRSEHYPIANDTRGASADLSWALNDYTLKSISAWRDYHFDFGSPNFSNPTPFDILRGPSSGLGYFRQLTQELRIQSPEDNDFSYQAGVFYADVFRSSGGEGRGNKYGSDAGAYFANAAQYTRLDADSNGRYLLINSLNGLKSNSYSAKDDNTLALFGNIKWELTNRFTLDTGLRVSQEDRRADVNYNRIFDQGYGAELNPVFVDDVQLGGFSNNASGALLTNNPAQLALADAAALKYFKLTSYEALSAAQKQQVADAKAIRAARLSGIYNQVAAEPFDETLYTFNLSPSYKITETQTSYFSFRYGEKAGVSQIVGATTKGGTSYATKAEQNFSYEIGLRSSFLDGALAINTTLFSQKVKDYIANLYFYDEAQTIANNDGNLAYISAVGNIPEVKSQGLELDATYTLRNTTFRFAGAYNDAKYVDEKFHAKPLELGGTAIPYQDVSGQRLPGVGKFSFNAFLEHQWPLAGAYNLTANVNYNYTSSYLSDPSLSRYSKVDAYGLTDASIGLGKKDGKLDIRLLAKNLFDIDYGYQPVWNLSIPSTPRWIGLSLSSEF
ncbi:MAG TPA: TonB-dependent receptor [Cellvibrio sp.]|nr:TonB-dependent receptor [Cellvibrio sp.]